MASPELNIRIGADVNEAIRGLSQVQDRMRTTGAAGQSFGSAIQSGVSKANNELKKLPQASNAATQSLTNLSRVAQDAPYGFIGIANNLNPLLESFQRLKVQTGSTGGALKALGKEMTGAGGLGLAIGVASSLLVVFGDKLFGASKAAKEAQSSASKLKESISGIFAEAGKEAAQAASFVAVLKSETETRERKLAAIKELQKIQPEVFANLKLEGQAVKGLDDAYQNYLANLRNVIAANIKRAQLEQLITKQLELQGQAQTASEQSLMDGMKAFEEMRLKGAQGDPSQAGFLIQSITGKREARQRELNKVQSDIDAALKGLIELSKGVKVDPLKTDKVTVKPDELELLQPGKVTGKPISSTAQKDIFNALFGLDQPLTVDEQLSRKLSADIAKLVKPPSFDFPALRKYNEELKKTMMEQMKMAQMVGSVIADSFGTAFDAIAKGENVFKALGESLKQLVLDLIKATIQTLIFKAVANFITPGAGTIAGGFGGFGGGLGSLGGLGGGLGGRIAPVPVSGSMGGRMVIRGRELRLLGARTSSSQIRLGGR